MPPSFLSFQPKKVEIYSSFKVMSLNRRTCIWTCEARADHPGLEQSSDHGKHTLSETEFEDGDEVCSEIPLRWTWQQAQGWLVNEPWKLKSFSLAAVVLNRTKMRENAYVFKSLKERIASRCVEAKCSVDFYWPVKDKVTIVLMDPYHVAIFKAISSHTLTTGTWDFFIFTGISRRNPFLYQKR